MPQYERDPLERIREAGRRAIARPADPADPLPWDFRGTVFRCAWEYPVSDFEAEVGFHVDVLGFETIALNEEYALFTTRDRDLTFACRRHDLAHDLTGHTLCFMTRAIATFERALRERLPDGAVGRRSGSSVQSVLELRSPAGLLIEVWEYPDD